tara:strand:- start:1492 stop:2034 length:543 start_codon:yes stop_codon:yes gene_type:complete
MLSSNDTISNVLKQNITDDNFLDAEKEIGLMAKEFENIWNMYVNIDIINQELIYDDDDLFNSFIKDTKYFFGFMYKLYGNPQFLKEVTDALNSDEETDNDKKEMQKYINFVDNIKIIIDTEPNVFKDKNANVYTIMNDCSLYIKQKQDDLNDLNNTMKEMNDKLELLAEGLTSYLDKKLK